MALRKWSVQFTATLACIVLAFALGDRCAVDKPPLVDEVRPKVVICGKDFFVLEHYPKDASGRLQYDKKLIEECIHQGAGSPGGLGVGCRDPPPYSGVGKHKKTCFRSEVGCYYWVFAPIKG